MTLRPPFGELSKFAVSSKHKDNCTASPAHSWQSSQMNAFWVLGERHSERRSFEGALILPHLVPSGNICSVAVARTQVHITVKPQISAPTLSGKTSREEPLPSREPPAVCLELRRSPRHAKKITEAFFARARLQRRSLLCFVTSRRVYIHSFVVFRIWMIISITGNAWSKNLNAWYPLKLRSYFHYPTAQLESGVSKEPPKWMTVCYVPKWLLGVTKLSGLITFCRGSGVISTAG